MLARCNLGEGGSIARRPSPGRRCRLVPRSFSEGGSLPNSGLTPFLFVPFVLFVPFRAPRARPGAQPLPLLSSPDFNNSLHFHLFQLYFPLFTNPITTLNPLRQSHLQPQ